ncbi:nucleoside triphosphate pyrophosphatase [Gammaproteobacteria bacterium AB-CW1]|uniref:7-methyl-GTP pyrophosphatase n=1 Tax=Natronospira elongata TaxID=3110268 RepID=A0AAP6JGH7_9GAMM|nr:nucleoside triphosphate pyrophosphatase [Gammaproteobacteria bacterium AB-CW1]
MAEAESTPERIVLASRSPYRADLLRRLVPDFKQHPADIDESINAEESPEAYVGRLSREKALAVASACDEPALVIGSDQAAVLDGEILGKPGDLETGVAMLSRAAGHEVRFLTGLCLIDSRFPDRCVEHLDRTRVHFRQFGEDTARRYLEREPALDCAGSFRCEGLGISLFDGIESEDPTALIGLPLIAVARGLRGLGYEI